MRITIPVDEPDHDCPQCGETCWPGETHDCDDEPRGAGEPDDDAGPIETSPAYRRSIADAGRGHLLP